MEIVNNLNTGDLACARVKGAISDGVNDEYIFDSSFRPTSLTVEVSKQEYSEIELLAEGKSKTLFDCLTEIKNHKEIFANLYHEMFEEEDAECNQGYFAIIWLKIVTVQVISEKRYYLVFPFCTGSYYVNRSSKHRFEMYPNQPKLATPFTQKEIDRMQELPYFKKYNLNDFKVRKED